MPNGTEIAKETPAESGIQNVEDPNKVQDIFKEAAAALEYKEEEPPEPTPEEELEAQPAEPPKKKEKKVKKDEPEPKPEEKTPIEAAPEAKKSKRELFKEKADAEKAYREKESKLKEREANLQRLELAFKEFEADPIAYLEKKDPRAYEKWTERNLAAGNTPEKSEIATVKAEIEKLREELKGKQEETLTQVQQAQYAQYMNQAKSVLAGEEYKDVWESAKLFEAFTGNPVDVERVIASVYAEYKTSYNKELTPQDVCEIILEDAQAHLENVRASDVLKALYGSEKPAEKVKKKSPPLKGKTLTAEQETQSAPAKEVDYSEIKDKEQRLAAIAQMLEYEAPKEEE